MSEQNEIDESHNNKQEIANLMAHVKQLEEENEQLYENILKMGNKKQKKSLEYYVRLKKDLLEEENKLKNQLSVLENDKEQEKKGISFKLYNLKKKLDEKISENKTLKSLIDSHNKELEQKSKSLTRRNVELKNEINDKKIEELEATVTNLTNALSEKEFTVNEQKEKIDELQRQIDTLNETMNAEINDIKLQYENVYSASKQNEENFNKLYEDKTNNMKNDIQSNKYQLEKKLVHSKNLLNHLEKENNILKNVFESDLQIKKNEVNNLKENYEKINNLYNEFAKLCGGNLEKLKNNIKQMKEIYLDRENEIENISKIYVESMNNYAQALEETEKSKNLINTDSIENSILMNKLGEKKRILEEQINEFNKIKDESIGDDLPSIQNKISNMNQNVNHLNEKQKEFSTKIKKVNDFTNFLTKNNNIVTALEQDITKNKKRKEDLENKIHKMNIVEDEELNQLKEKLQKLEQDKTTKEESLKNYEKKFEEIIESMDNQEEVRTDVLKRLGDQIKNYQSQIDKLLESKDNMQAYYIEEVKKLKDKIQMITAENNELKNDNVQIQQENKSRKNIDDLCNKEYTEFKDAFYSISDIENMISEFNKSSEEIKGLRENLLSDEFLKIKEDIKIKKKELKILKNTTKDNATSTNRVSTNKSIITSTSINANTNMIKKKPENEIDEINRNIKLKLKIYNSLVNKKIKEVNGLEQHIKLIKDYNNYSKKSGENQELLCAENKIMTDEMVNELIGLNQFEEELKREVQFLEEKLKTNKEAHSNSLQILNNNVNQQLNAIKDRENYIVKQSEQITEGLKKNANQKKNAIDILKIENQQLKDRNYIINTKL